MVLWGGLRPIAAQVVADTVGLIGLTYVVVTPVNGKQNSLVLISTCLVVLLISGNLTNRWTMVLPMVPFVVLQGFRRLLVSFTSSTMPTTEEETDENEGGKNDDSNNNNSNNNKKEKRKQASCSIFKIVIGLLSFVCIFMAGALSILFPAVELPPLDDATYQVGVVDFFLSTDIQFTTQIADAQNVCPTEIDHVTIRVMYPSSGKLTKDGKPMTTKTSSPYLRPETAEAFCEETMKYGAPPPLQELPWMLHTWRLTQVDTIEHGKPLDGPFPLVIYSPGLGGSLEFYSYQTRSLASKGYIVVVVEHMDGSSAIVHRRDGTIVRRNESVLQDYIDGNVEKYRRSRRAMTEFRTEEVLAAVDGMITLNEKNIDQLEALDISFVGKIKTDQVHYMGHSFGGATALHAARKRPPTSVIAHEPATEWLPDATRGSLFDKQRLEGSKTNYTPWTSDVTDGYSSVHDVDMLILFSHEWETKGWGGIDVLKDMHRQGKFGRKTTGTGTNRDGESGTNTVDDSTCTTSISHVDIVNGAHHNEFSDTCMLTPVWLARGIGVTGQRNPLDTARDIHMMTMEHLNKLESL